MVLFLLPPFITHDSWLFINTSTQEIRFLPKSNSFNEVSLERRRYGRLKSIEQILIQLIFMPQHRTTNTNSTWDKFRRNTFYQVPRGFKCVWVYVHMCVCACMLVGGGLEEKYTWKSKWFVLYSHSIGKFEVELDQVALTVTFFWSWHNCIRGYI